MARVRAGPGWTWSDLPIAAHAVPDDPRRRQMTDKPSKLQKSSSVAEPAELPVLPLRDVVVFPHMVIPLFVGREKSVRALEIAMAGNKQILLVAQRSPDIDEPAAGDLYTIGTIASVLQLLKLPDGTIKVLVEGTQRAEIAAFGEREGLMVAHARALDAGYTRSEREIEVIGRQLMNLFEQLVKLS